MKVSEFILGLLALLLFTFCFVSCSFIGAALEQDMRCKNGAAVYCLE